MDLCYKNPGFQYSVDSIMLFQVEDMSEMWQGPLFHYYPQLDRSHFASLPLEQRNEYLYNNLHETYERERENIAQKQQDYTRHWNAHKSRIEAAFSDAFGLDCSTRYNDNVGNITLNPICPRFLEKREFDVFYLNSERGALGIAMHEIMHFVWFDVWQRHFKDRAEEYEAPHIKWVLSEMAVDPIMHADTRLSQINPYFEDGCAYDYFYRMKIDGAPILETLYKMYKNANIISFMEQAYDYCLRHEPEIRSQME